MLTYYYRTAKLETPMYYNSNWGRNEYGGIRENKGFQDTNKWL